HDNAVAASMGSPVSSISMARFRPMFRTTPTAGVEQNTPMLTPGIANVAVSAATAMSHIDTSWQPAAVAIPWTRAITGCGLSVRVATPFAIVERTNGCFAVKIASERISAILFNHLFDSRGVHERLSALCKPPGGLIRQLNETPRGIKRCS